MLKKFSKNFLYLSVSTITGKLFFFAMVIIISRALGASELGKYAFSLSFVMLFSALLDIGLFTLAIRDISQDIKLSVQYFINILSIKVILGLLVFLVINFVLKFMPWSKDSIINIYLLYLFIFLDSLNLVPKIIFRAHGKMHFEMISEISGKAFGIIIAVFLAFFINAQLSTLLVAMISGNFISLLLSCLLIKNEFPEIKFTFKFEFWRHLIKAAFPFLIAWFFMSIFTSLDKIFLKAFYSNAAVGLYSAAYVIANVIQLLPFIISSVLFPSMARDYKENKLELKKSCNIALKIGLVTSFLIASLIFFSSNFIVRTLFHFDPISMSSTISYLRIIIWTQVPIFAYSMITILFLCTDSQNMLIMVNGIGFIVSLITNLVFIYYFGVSGACFAAIILHAIILFAALILVKKKIFDIDSNKTILKFGLAACGFTATYLLMQNEKYIVPFVSIPVFIIILYLVRFFGQNDLGQLKTKFSSIHNI